MDYFQDDIFPDTKVTWEPAVSAENWFSGIFNFLFELNSF